MAFLTPPLQSTPISTSSVKFNPIFHNHSQIPFLRDRNPCFALRGSRKLIRRNLLFTTLGGIGLSKMSGNTGDRGESAQAAAESTHRVVQLSEFPITLDSVVSVIVPRPKTSRTKQEKRDEEEVLAIQGIEFLGDAITKFDVHVNDDEDSLSRPGNSEFAGSFVHLPSRRRKTVTTSLRLGITDLLDDVGADGDGSIKVTLVPKQVHRPLTIGQIKIEFLK